MERVAGIIGGVGPKATVDLCDRIIEHTPADSDQDHIQLLIYNNPKIPNRYNAIIGNGSTSGAEDPGPYLVETAKKLESMGSDFLAIASNLTHYYYDTVSKEVEIPVLHIVASTAEWIVQKYSFNRVGILAPSPTLKSELYQKELSRQGLTPVVLDPHRTETLVDESIYGSEGLKAGFIEHNKDSLVQAVQFLKQEGAQATILACTELPLALGTESPFDDHCLINSTTVLAKKIVDVAKEKLEFPS